MNSTLLKTSPFIHYPLFPSSRISIQYKFPLSFYHQNRTAQWGTSVIQISRNSKIFNTSVYPKKPINIQALTEEPTKDLLKRFDLDKFKGVIRCGLMMGLLVFGLIRCQKVLAMESGSDFAQKMKAFWNGPKFLQVLRVFREQGLILAGLLGLSAFFSMAETSITTLSPWKVRELAEKEGENGVFKLLRTDITRFLTTILIGTTVVNIGATALFTEAATTVFGEAGVGAATGVMTVVVLLLTEITPKSIAVHNATAVARAVIQELVEAIVLPMTHKERFQNLGVRPPKGVLLYGPPLGKL